MTAARVVLLTPFTLALFASVGGCGGRSEGGAAADSATPAIDGGADSVADSVADTFVFLDSYPDSPPIDAAGREPVRHRPAPLACAPDRIAGIRGGTPGCTADAECTEGKEGRCGYDSATSRDKCTYDACLADGDCAAGEVCICRNEFSATLRQAWPTVCAKGNCVVDANCGPGGYCSPNTVVRGCNSGLEGWYCHTKLDRCIDDADCYYGGLYGKCQYDRVAGYWACALDSGCHG